jgi:hypothetical protein
MDQFQANLRALDRHTPPSGAEEAAEGLAGLAGTPVPYPENRIWAAAVRAWDPSAAASAEAGPVPDIPAAPMERVDSCRGLRPGAAVQARGPRGAVAFEGTVEEVFPAQNLFWAVSANGNRRIIELDEYDVYTG